MPGLFSENTTIFFKHTLTLCHFEKTYPIISYSLKNVVVLQRYLS